jgi:tRNA(Ile)-lysidine synthase
MQLIAKVRRFIRQHDLMRPDTRAVCALSGGSDSVALARILAALHDSGDVQFVGLVHINHQLRPTAARDEQFCRDLARALDRPILVERIDVAARASAAGQSLETAAHDARYAAYATARGHFDAAAVALGHTRDDQAETFLLRLLRGAGPKGLAAMHPRHGDIIRPLLDCTRAELRESLAGARPELVEGYVDDESNADTSIPRNAIRAELLPHLARYNPNIVDTLAREADLAREIWSWLEDELRTRNLELRTQNKNPEPATRNPLPAGLDVDRLRTAPRALQRLALWHAMSERAAGSITTAHVDAALHLLDAHDGASVDVPGMRVHRIATRIVLSNRSENRANHENPENLWWFPLSIPGEVTANALALSAELVDGWGRGEPGAAVGNGPVAAVRADLLCTGAASPLAVRNRRPGDRFRPVGLAGRKKLQDLFVDRKIARADRDSVPIVVDDRDQIVWVAGYGIDEAFRVTDPSQKVVVLKLRYLHPTAQKTRGGDPVER